MLKWGYYFNEIDEISIDHEKLIFFSIAFYVGIGGKIMAQTLTCTYYLFMHGRVR